MPQPSPITLNPRLSLPERLRVGWPALIAIAIVPTGGAALARGHWWLGLSLWLFIPPLELWAVRLIRPAVRARAELIERLHLLCRHCGYNLQATPARCPECGALPLDRAAG